MLLGSADIFRGATYTLEVYCSELKGYVYDVFR